MHTLHPLELSPYSVPVRLHVLGVDSCRWIYKVKGVVHSVVEVHRLQLLDTVVGSPLIIVYCCPVPKVALQYRQQSDWCRTSQKPTLHSSEDVHGDTGTTQSV